MKKKKVKVNYTLIVAIVVLLVVIAVFAFSGLFGITGSAVNDCVSGDQRCGGANNKYMQSCVNSKWTSLGKCTTGCYESTDETGGVTPVCITKYDTDCDSTAVGDTKCSTDYVDWSQKCVKAKDSTYGWINKEFCDNGCDDGTGECIVNICEPGETRCDGGYLTTCSTSGRWGTENKVQCETKKCGSQTDCKPGICNPLTDTTPRCSPDDPRYVQQCSLFQWKNTKRCEHGCSDGVCLGLVEAADCTIDTLSDKKCSADGDWLQRCVKINSTTTGWLNSQYCKNGCSYNQCNAQACTEGESRCVALQNVKGCVGGRWHNQGECLKPKVCKEKIEGGITKAYCESEGCTPYETQCDPIDSKRLQKCSVNSKWLYYKTCSTGCGVTDGKADCMGVIPDNTCTLEGLRCGAAPWSNWIQRCVYKDSAQGWWNYKECDNACTLVKGKPTCTTSS